MNGIINQESKNIFDWFNWLNRKWSNYQDFIDFQHGIEPKQVAINFLDLNRVEFLEFIESLDKEDLEAIDQIQKITESESYVFKLIREQILNKNKVKYVDFKNRTS
tara:strand:+ start:1660 stop:1977 length:318 start_codon:yes stop_codon:yes gene_type:complete